MKNFIAGLIVLIVVVVLPLVIFWPTQAHASSWNGPVQCSNYDYTNGVTASGVRMTNKTMHVAVPRSKVVSKKTWKNGSKSLKKTHFYYGEKLKLKHGKYVCTVKVTDCGGFGKYGTRYKGKWCPRLFDLQPAVKRKLHVGDVDIIKWKIA